MGLMAAAQVMTGSATIAGQVVQDKTLSIPQQATGTSLEPIFETELGTAIKSGKVQICLNRAVNNILVHRKTPTGQINEMANVRMPDNLEAYCQVMKNGRGLDFAIRTHSGIPELMVVGIFTSSQSNTTQGIVARYTYIKAGRRWDLVHAPETEILHIKLSPQICRQLQRQFTSTRAKVMRPEVAH